MSVKQFATQMRVIIEDLKSKGTAAIYCDNLIAYLNEVQNSPEQEPSPVEIERYKADLQNWVEAHKHQHEQQLEMFRSVITSGQSAIKSSFLLNGGAAVAILAFIGHIAEFNASMVPVFASCLLPFTYGVLAIVITSGFTYLTQWLYACQSSGCGRAAFTLNLICIAFGLVSYAMFIWGLFSTYSAFIAYV